MANSNNRYAFPAPHQDQPSFNQNYLQQPMSNPEDITDPTTAMNMALTLMAKPLKLNYSTPTNNNQKISSNPRNRQIAQSARAEGNAGGQNRNQIRCYNCRGKEEAGIQLQLEEYDLMATTTDLDEIKEVNVNCILMANLQQASTSGTQTDNALVYDTDGSAENDNDVISEDTSAKQGGETVEQHPPDSFYHTEQKMALGYQNPFYLKQAQKKQQSLYDGKVLLEKHDPFVLHDSEETLQLAQESRDEMKQMNKEIKAANYTKINHLSRVFVPQTALSREELYFSNNSKMANVSKSFSIPNEDLLDDTTPSVARKFLNEEAAKFVGEFKSLANEADASLAKHKTLELEIKHLLKAVLFKKVSDQKDNTQDTITSNSVSTPQESKGVNNDKVIAPGMFKINPSKISKEEKHVPNTVSASNRIKPITVSQPPIITKKDVNSDLNGVDNTKTRRPQPSSNTKHDRVPSASKRSQSKNKEAEVEEHHRNLLLSKNNKHISSACNNIQIDSKDLFKKVFDKKDNNHDTSKNTKFTKQPNVEILPKIGETNALSKPVTSNSVSKPPVSKGMNTAKVIAPGMFRISPDKLGDLKGKSKDTSSVSDTRNPLSQKFENENVELEF
nr:Gag-Pol polyprotein [Tanacetum cinerariifolium]